MKADLTGAACVRAATTKFGAQAQRVETHELDRAVKPARKVCATASVWQNLEPRGSYHNVS